MIVTIMSVATVSVLLIVLTAHSGGILILLSDFLVSFDVAYISLIAI